MSVTPQQLNLLILLTFSIHTTANSLLASQQPKQLAGAE